MKSVEMSSSTDVLTQYGVNVVLAKLWRQQWSAHAVQISHLLTRFESQVSSSVLQRQLLECSSP